MNINIFNLLIATGIIHGIVFSTVILFVGKYRTKSNSYLALVVLFLSLHNLFYWVRDVELDSGIPDFNFYYIPWNLLILPTYYSFVTIYFQKTTNKNYLFFVPFIISSSIHFFLLSHSLITGNTYLLLGSFIDIFYDVEEYLAALFTAYLIWKTFDLIKSYETNRNYNRKSPLLEVSWLKKLLNFGLIICSLWVITTLYSSITGIPQFNLNLRYFVWIGISTLIYWLGYLGVYHGVVFRQRKNLKKRIQYRDKEIISKNKNSIVEKIEQIIKEEKLFLDPLLSISKISERLGISEQYFSRVFNQNFNDSFSTYLNKLRVKEAEKLLSNIDYKNYTIVSIGLESGFNSKSAFYRVFKFETGFTPSQYRKKSLS